MGGHKVADNRQALMVLAVIILSGLVFAAGVIVGQRLVRCPEPPTGDPLKQIDAISARPQIDSRTLSFPETLNGPRPKPPHRPEETPRVSGGDAVVEGKSPVEISEEKVKPAPLNPGATPLSFTTVPVGRFCMQVASYRDRSQAQALVNRLLSRGYSGVRVVEGVTSEKGVVYRVRVGHFSSREEAERHREKMVKGENLSVLVVSEE